MLLLPHGGAHGPHGLQLGVRLGLVRQPLPQEACTVQLVAQQVRREVDLVEVVRVVVRVASEGGGWW